MEPSSIVSFHNESTLKPEYGVNSSMKEVNVHELALHAMRDRCLLLQRRINSLENDNMRLKLGADSEIYCSRDKNESYQLRSKLAELTKQKSQLMHHVFMVTCENKSLWNRLAKLKVAPKCEIPQLNFTTNFENSPQKQVKLLRTNTYIQSSTPKVDQGQEKFSDASLEEISLKLIDSYIQEKSQLVQQCEQMAEMQSVEDFLNLDSIGFTYVDDQSTDSLKELRSQTEKLSQLKNEVSKQEEQLMKILSNVEKFLNGERKCSNCAAREINQVSTENKEIETSDSLGEWATPAHSNTYQEENISELQTNTPSVSHKETAAHLQKRAETPTDREKICPMCGQVFNKECSFAEFQQHVESHFIGDPEPDSIDFEIARNVGNNDSV